jgi:predicted amidophosphoribosyltransferase
MDPTNPSRPQHPPRKCPLPIPAIALRCPTCAYDLTGLTEPRCPECGNRFDLDDIVGLALDDNAPVREAVLRLTFGDLAGSLAGPICGLAGTIGVTLTSAVGVLAQRHLDAALGREPTPDDFARLYDTLAAARPSLIAIPRPPRTLGADFTFPDTDLRCRRCRAPLIDVRDLRCPRCSVVLDPAALLPRDTLVAVTREFRQRQPLAILLARTTLENDGVPNASSAGDGTLRTIAGISAATLSVPRSYYFDAVALLIERRAAAESSETPGDDWPCPACGESVPATFDLCWNCGRPRA